MRLTGQVLTAREAAVDALTGESGLAAASDRLEHAANLAADVVVEGDDGLTARAWRGYSEALRALSDIGDWDLATLAAEADSDRHLRAARRRSEVALSHLDREHPAHEPIAATLERLTTVGSLSEADAAAQDLVVIPLPTPLIAAPSARRPTRAATEEEDPAAPRAVCLVSHDGSPLVAPVVVRPGTVHALTVTARVLDWPETFPELVIQPLSVWPASAAEATEIRLERPEKSSDGIHEAEGTTNVVLHATAAASQPVGFTFKGDLRGEVTQPTLILGYTGFALRPFDPTLDVETGIEVVDGRLRELFEVLRGKAPEGEVGAFARLMSAACRAAVRIQADNIFRKGTKVPEDDFQSQMQARLGMAAELGGRLHRCQQAGGVTDLVHDDIPLELKVEPDEPVTQQVAARHVGQPVQYATGGGKQLSVLCILDMASKEAPVGVLANSVYLLEPRLHGLTEPEYPSWVGVVVIGGNLPVPSAWSGKRLSATAT